MLKPWLKKVRLNLDDWMDVVVCIRQVAVESGDEDYAADMDALADNIQSQVGEGD